MLQFYGTDGITEQSGASEKIGWEELIKEWSWENLPKKESGELKFRHPK